jgi:putative PIN family toxin of toxin-antitoxin system
MSVVFDTVILVRGLINQSGWCGRLLHERRNRYRLVVSPAVLAEYLAVLQRPALVRKYGVLESHELRDVLNFVASGILVDPPRIPAVCRDPADDMFLAAAEAGEARFIVSEDRDLLNLDSFRDIPIITAATLLRILDERDDSLG